MTVEKALKIEQMLKKEAEKALGQAEGNRTKAAEILGVSVRTVRNWIKKFNLSEKYPFKRGRKT